LSERALNPLVAPLALYCIFKFAEIRAIRGKAFLSLKENACGSTNYGNHGIFGNYGNSFAIVAAW
jgi:hypothetical protein